MLAPTTAPEAEHPEQPDYSDLVGVDPALIPPKFTPAQQAAQDKIDAEKYGEMLEECIPTLKANHAGAVYLMAVLKQQGDTHVKRRHFLRAASKVKGAHPPFMELALEQIRASKGAQ